MKKVILFVAVAISSFLINKPQTVLADTAGASAVLTNTTSDKPRDNRAEILRSFLESRNSPLAPYAQTFIAEADKNRIDWKWVVSIAGNESQFGQQIPSYSYNGWGFGVFGTNVRAFSSWDEGITVVSRAIRTDYIDSWGAKNIYEIGALYAEDPLWANKVVNYVSQLEDFESHYSNRSLSISL